MRTEASASPSDVEVRAEELVVEFTHQEHEPRRRALAGLPLESDVHVVRVRTLTKELAGLAWQILAILPLLAVPDHVLDTKLIGVPHEHLKKAVADALLVGLLDADIDIGREAVLMTAAEGGGIVAADKSGGPPLRHLVEDAGEKLAKLKDDWLVCFFAQPFPIEWLGHGGDLHQDSGIGILDSHSVHQGAESGMQTSPDAWRRSGGRDRTRTCDLLRVKQTRFAIVRSPHVRARLLDAELRELENANAGAC